MNKNLKRVPRTQRGSALLIAIGILLVMSVAATTYIGHSLAAYNVNNRETKEIETTPLCEAAGQQLLYNLWIPFQNNQNFTNLDSTSTGSSVSNPTNTISGSIAGVGNYSAGVIGYEPDPSNPNYDRLVTIRCVGWIDQQGTGVLTPQDPQKIIDITVDFTLERSQVFDYTYFVNNFGWWDGFTPSDAYINGDMRANGNFSFTNGSPTVNGSVYAAYNNLLIPASQGLINQAPVKDSDSQYLAAEAGNPRMRQGYNSSTMGAVGSSTWKQWSNNIFESTGSIQNNQTYGAVLGSAVGTQSWQRTSTATSGTTNLLDSTPSQQVAMPDLSNLSVYQNLSSSYVDEKATWPDGTTNPNYGKGAYLQVWNSSLNGGAGAYQTITTNGEVNGSAAIVGSQSHPIIIHGPVTFSQDCVIKGYVSGQGTIYTGRNVNVVGSIIYSNPPNFQGTNSTTINNANAKADMLGLAARGSIIMGDVSQFSNPYPLEYMTPPFTKPRYDANGNLIPAYNATATDSTGYMLYQSVLGNSLIHKLAAPVDQIDAVMYTNFVGGGDLGVGGTGVTINGSIISKDEAMVTWSLPMILNYDGRIKEQSPGQSPLIDINLPRSPAILSVAWQDRGFYYSSN